MASTRPLAVALLAVASMLTLSACTPPVGGALTPTDQDAVRAITTAESVAGGRAFELDTDDDQWQVHVAVGDREVEVRVSADGARADSPGATEELDADDGAALQATTTTLADAIRIAAARAVGGARVEEAALEQEEGTPVWSVDIAGGTTIRVSGIDGSIR